MRFFKKRIEPVAGDPAEERFDAMMQLVKNLPKPDYNRFRKAMDLGYESYQTVRGVKDLDERENGSEINEAESKLIRLEEM